MKKPAFTLLEMLIAITVFTIFVSFSISTYLTFHRANQEAIAQRSVMLELQATMNLLSEAVKKNTIDYNYYSGGDGFTIDDLLSDLRPEIFAGSRSAGDINTTTLVLWSPDGETQYVYDWDEEEETLTMQTFDAEGSALTDAVLLHNETTRVSYVNFRIFPDESPYENTDNDDLQYQPTVQIALHFVVPGRVREEITVDLQTSITSRFYQ